jgi:Serine phosphatase RsbU, regulator of sigma subunit
MDSAISVDLAKAKRFRWLIWDLLLLFLGVLLGVGTFAPQGGPRPLNLQVQLVGWSVVIAVVLAYHWFARRCILTVSSSHVSLSALTGSFNFPVATIRRLAFYQPIRRRGLSGIYTIETRDGAVGRIVVEPRDRKNPLVADMLLRIEAATGLVWVGRDSADAPRQSGIRTFLASLRRGSQTQTRMEFAAWCARSALSIRGELAGIGGPVFRWGVSFFGFALACLLILALSGDVVTTSEGLKAGWNQADSTDAPKVKEGAKKLSERLMAQGNHYSRQADELAKESGAFSLDNFRFLVAFFVWCSTCFGVNVLLTLMRDQRRTTEAFEAELTAARDVQSRLLPNRTPEIPPFEIAGACLPAYDVGGDYFDYVPIGSGGLVIPIADVSGKGLGAGLLMTLTKGYLTASLEQGADLLQSLSFLNRKIRDSAKESAFVSMALLKLDPASRSVLVARAGHNFPLLIRSGAEEAEWIKPPGLALGVQGPIVFDRACRTEEIQFGDGDLLVLYTDGLTEAMNGQGDEYGEDRFAAIVKASRSSSASAIRDSILADVLAFRAGTPANDDLTLVVVRRVA